MPDFLGEDQRKTKPDDGGEEKIRCQFICKLFDKEKESRRERKEREFCYYMVFFICLLM